MRAILLLAATLALLLASGCAAPAQPAPASPAASTTTHPGSGGNQGIAVGEPNPGQPGGMSPPGGHGGAAPRPEDAHNQTATLDLVGRTSATSLVAGGLVRFDFTAANLAGDAKIVGPICGLTPWSWRLLGPDGAEVQPHAPMAHCMAYGESPFAAGAKADGTFEWNGTLAQDGAVQPAPQGTYHLETTFTALRGEDRDTVTLTMPVSVVAQGQT